MKLRVPDAQREPQRPYPDRAAQLAEHALGHPWNRPPLTRFHVPVSALQVMRVERFVPYCGSPRLLFRGLLS